MALLPWLSPTSGVAGFPDEETSYYPSEIGDENSYTYVVPGSGNRYVLTATERSDDTVYVVAPTRR